MWIINMFVSLDNEYEYDGCDSIGVMDGILSL